MMSECTFKPQTNSRTKPMNVSFPADLEQEKESQAIKPDEHPFSRLTPASQPPSRMNIID